MLGRIVTRSGHPKLGLVVVVMVMDHQSPVNLRPPYSDCETVVSQVTSGSGKKECNMQYRLVPVNCSLESGMLTGPRKGTFLSNYCK